MHRFAAPLFILFLTALAFGQTELQAPTAQENPVPSELNEAPAQPTQPAPAKPNYDPLPQAPEPEAEAAPATPENKKIAEPEKSEEATDALELVVIASSSLNDTWDNQAKLDALKAAMKEAIRYIPPDMDVGLRVSGHRVPASDADRSCQDSELLIAPKAQGQSILLSELDAVQAQGRHSLIQTISRSLADLNDYKGDKNIIVITDGTEACVEQEPTAYLAAASLGQRGYHIHFRGIGLQEEQGQDLAKLAQLTGGTFSTAQNSEMLQKQLVDALRLLSGEAPQPTKTARQDAPQKPGEPVQKAQGETVPRSIPATPPPSGMAPEPKSPPIVGPAPLPFNPKEFKKELLTAIKKMMPKPQKPAAPPPPPPTPTFSATSLTIIIIQSVLLALALAGIVLLALKQYRQ